jgi:hypothetical protein
MLLTNSQVSQVGGNVTFQVTYSDFNNNAPTQATVYVNGNGNVLPLQMSYVSGSYNTGAIYQLTTTLSPGAYTLYYVFFDGQTSWGIPLSPGSIGFNVSATSAKPHSIAFHIPSYDLSNILSNPADPGDID